MHKPQWDNGYGMAVLQEIYRRKVAAEAKYGASPTMIALCSTDYDAIIEALVVTDAEVQDDFVMRSTVCGMEIVPTRSNETRLFIEVAL